MKLIDAFVIYVANHYIDVLSCDNWSYSILLVYKEIYYPKIAWSITCEVLNNKQLYENTSNQCFLLPIWR